MMKILLFPFAVLYDMVTNVRNRLYDLGLKPSASFDVKLISVGNLAVGGTGKTPMIEHLVRLLKSSYKVATLSRGYGRSTRGIRLAGAADNAQTLGDEPFQFYKKFKNEVAVIVGEERALAIPYLMDEHPDTQVVLMDDAFQHRKVKPHFSILLTDFNRPFYEDLLVPAGRLRESKKGAGRADVIVVTKCPDEITEERMMEMASKIRVYSKRPVFFSRVRYGQMIGFRAAPTRPVEKVILVSGIANHRPLEEHVAANYRLIRHFAFRDHHQYRDEDLKRRTGSERGSHCPNHRKRCRETR
jgi:tetraacyldisaccharide 4'-kinase